MSCQLSSYHCYFDILKELKQRSTLTKQVEKALRQIDSYLGPNNHFYSEIEHIYKQVSKAGNDESFQK